MIKKIIALCLAAAATLNIAATASAANGTADERTADIAVNSAEYNDTAAKPRTIYSQKDPEIDEHNTFIADLGGIYEVTDTFVTQYNSSVNGLESYDVYLSSDGINYMLIGAGEAVNKVDYTINTIPYAITQRMYARYVKLVMHKAEGREGVMITEISVSGKEGISESRIDGDAEYSYYTQNPYKTSDDIIMQDPDRTKLTDGDTESVISTKEKWATVVVDLKKPYQIGNVDIYSLANGNTFMEGCEIRYSLDGKKYFTYTYYLNHNDKNGGIVKSSFSGMPGRNARYLKIIMQSSTSDMAVSEICVNGYPVENAASEKPSQVPLRVEMKNYLLAYLDWSTFNTDNVSKVALYIEKTPFTSTDGLKPVDTYAELDDAFINKYVSKTGLEPETTYYFAVTPFDKDGNERKDVTPVKVTTQGVLSHKVKDAFNITNHPNYGGSATVGYGSYMDTMKKEAVRLMDEMGASNKNRLWEVSGSNTQMYTDIGVSTMLQNMSTASKAYGNYLYSNGNESDLIKVDVNEFLNGMKSAYSLLKTTDSRNVLCDPVLGGTEAGSLKWFDDLYKAGNGIETKLNFDAVDVHFYCKTVDEQISGLPVGAPEILFKKIASVREVMARYGDEDKPIISTETGFHTADVNGYMPKITYETQRDYIVRMYMIMISQGVWETWYYNFQDDGPRTDYHEHNWGLIDYYGVPKPAYYSYYNMYQQMRNAEYLGAVAGLSNPYYGYEFYDEMKNKTISVVWAADGQFKTMQFAANSGHDETIEVIGCDGSFSVINTENGMGSVSIGSGPIYIYSDKGIKPMSINTAFAARATEKDTIRGKDVTFTLTRKAMGKGASGRVDAVGMPEGWSIVGSNEFNSEQNSIDIVIHVPEITSETTHEFDLSVSTDNDMTIPIKVKVNVNPAISVRIVPEPVEFGKWDKWRLAAYCTNTTDVPVSGTLGVLASSGINISTLEMQKLDNIAPGQTVTVYFDADAPGYEYGAAASFVLEVNGQKKAFDRKLNFSACVNDGITPVMDGVISPGEWDNCQVIANDSSKFSAWKGEADLSFKVYRKWDDDNFYMAVDVTDDVFCQPYKDSDVWQGDNIQVALDTARVEGVGVSNTDYFEIGLSRNDNNQLMTWAWLADLVTKKERVVSSYKGAVNRTADNHTIYEIAIPWAYLKETGKVSEYDMIGFSVAVNDNDGTGRKGYLMYMRGITDKKDANAFEDMILIKK
ncbi:MAG: discoidin domain-containing protein [Clostridiales bacterium]|nr:discoidin domain-containing protein [Clostridiales bacterium]